MAKISLQDNNLLAAALEGLELQRARLTQQIDELRVMLGKGKPGRKPKAAAAVVAESEASAKKAPRKKRKLSAEARQRIAAAQKKRWAEHRKAKA